MGVPAGAGLLSGEAAMRGDAVKGTYCVSRTVRWYHQDRLTGKDSKEGDMTKLR